MRNWNPGEPWFCGSPCPARQRSRSPRISEVLSNPQALAQFAANGWPEHLPDALASCPPAPTAEASRQVGGSHFRAAVASLQAASQHGLEVLAYPINDVGRKLHPFPPACSVRLPSAGRDKATHLQPLGLLAAGEQPRRPASMPCAASPIGS